MASNLVPVEVLPGLSIATVTGTLQAKDNKFLLEPLTKSQIHEYTSSSPTHSLPPVHYTWGTFDLSLFMQLLTQAGIYDAVFEKTTNGCIIKMVSNQSSYFIYKTHYIILIFINSYNFIMNTENKRSLHSC